MSVKAKDFILEDVTTLESKKVVERKKRDYVPPEKQWELLYHNECDIVIRKKTLRTSSILAFMLSQGQVYVKNEKDGVMFKPTADEAMAFLRGSPWYNKVKPEKLQCDFIRGYSRKYFGDIYSKMFEVPDEVKILVNNQHYEWRWGLAEKLKEVGSDYKWVREYINGLGFGDVDTLLALMKSEGSIWTKDFLRNNVEKFRELGQSSSYRFWQEFPRLINEYRCDIDRLHEYITQDLKNYQGLEMGNSMSLKDLYDYYSLQQQLYGKVREKYPDNFLTDKSKLIARKNRMEELNRKLRYGNKEEEFKETMKRVAGFKFKYGGLELVIPECTGDIIAEGQGLGHCVAGYVERICDGKTTVVFVRKKDALNVPLMTMELVRGTVESYDVATGNPVEVDKWDIPQFKGARNRMPLEDETLFLIKFAKKYSIGIENVNNNEYTTKLKSTIKELNKVGLPEEGLGQETDLDTNIKKEENENVNEESGESQVASA